MYKKQRAFTLVEVMVVIAIIAILAYISTPYLSSLLINSELKEARNTLIQTLNKAKVIATSEATLVDIIIENTDDSQKATISYISKNNSIDRTVELPKRITLKEKYSFTFNALGLLIDDAGAPITGNVTLKPKNSDDLSETVEISNTGLIAST